MAKETGNIQLGNLFCNSTITQPDTEPTRYLELNIRGIIAGAYNMVGSYIINSIVDGEFEVV